MIIKRIPVGPLETNAFILGDEETKICAVIDPGDEGARIMAVAKEAGLDIRFILLTHGHFDHIMGVPEIKRKTGAKIVCHPLTEKSLQSDAESLASAVSMTGEKVEADTYVKEGDTIDIGSLKVRVLETPGHMPGSLLFVVGDVIFAGDTVFLENCGRCDLPGGNYMHMLASLKRIHDMTGDYAIHTGHGPSTSLAHERKYNPYMREAVR